MPGSNNLDFYDESDDFDGLVDQPDIRHIQPENRRGKKRSNFYLPKHPPKEVVDQMDHIVEFDFTYKATLYEKDWLLESLAQFYNNRWIDDVLRIVKGGKEASVYLCKGNEAIGGKFVAAKVYRPRKFRNLKNDQLYREGRNHLDADGLTIIDDGKLHAIQQRTRYGQELIHTSWIEHEYQTMQVLYASGADIPKPYARGHNAILMTYIGAEVLAAPTLNTVNLEKDEAQLLFERCLKNIDLMLAHERIHGDYSAYNILYWEGAITVIDFPQVVSPKQNRNAYAIFERDVRRICEYFAEQGIESDPKQIAEEMWRAHGYRVQTPVDPRLLDAEDDADRSYWLDANGD
ncbi:MAG: hypothetical protein JXB38_07985 [Anaerolineales bacterium]|nr:hypothetical protein [Anaerolineales bacterium]